MAYANSQSVLQSFQKERSVVHESIKRQEGMILTPEVECEDVGPRVLPTKGEAMRIQVYIKNLAG